MYYDYNDILSRNAMINFILTNRGLGKTYGIKKKFINNFLKKGEQFVYVRRYKTEFKKILTFFDDIADQFPNHSFKCTKNFAYIDDKVCGYFIPLSTAKMRSQQHIQKLQ
jgi:predicted AAA+ superfamily ATPase